MVKQLKTNIDSLQKIISRYESGSERTHLKTASLEHLQAGLKELRMVYNLHKALEQAQSKPNVFRRIFTQIAADYRDYRETQRRIKLIESRARERGQNE
jgi:hypothetical protein